MPDRDRSERLLQWLNVRAAVPFFTRDDGVVVKLAPSAGAHLSDPHRFRWPYGPAWRALAWLRWAARRGPKCGDPDCSQDDHQPGTDDVGHRISQEISADEAGAALLRRARKDAREGRLRQRSADEIHREDMTDPAYRRAYWCRWPVHQFSLLWLRLRVRLKRRS